MGVPTYRRFLQIRLVLILASRSLRLSLAARSHQEQDISLLLPSVQTSVCVWHTIHIVCTRDRLTRYVRSQASRRTYNNMIRKQYSSSTAGIQRCRIYYIARGPVDVSIALLLIVWTSNTHGAGSRNRIRRESNRTRQ